MWDIRRPKENFIDTKLKTSRAMFPSTKLSQFRTKIHPGDAKIIFDELAPYREKSSEILIFNGFYNMTRKILLISQLLFGVFPLKGLKHVKTSSKLTFSFKSFQFIYSAIIQCGMIVMFSTSIYLQLRNHIEYTKFIFFFLNFLVYLNFTMVARKWPGYVLLFERAERKLMEFHVMQLQDIKVKQKIRRVFTIIMILAFVEHNLGIASGVFLSKSCWDVRSAEEAYFRQSFTEFFSIFTFNIYLGLFAQIVNVFCTFAWNFIDVYLIVISILLTEKFSCINRRISGNPRITSSQFWSEIWSSYKVSVDLVDRTNELNGGTVLISFFSNLFFICVQLLGSFKSESSLIDGLYSWFSLLLLIGRTLAVCWYASKINDEARKPLTVLRSIHSDHFDTTMRRFCEQLRTEKVALTGMNFFYLTRKLILSISGTVVTYELVMVQFNEAEKEKSDNNPCT